MSVLNLKTNVKKKIKYNFFLQHWESIYKGLSKVSVININHIFTTDFLNVLAKSVRLILKGLFKSKLHYLTTIWLWERYLVFLNTYLVKITLKKKQQQKQMIPNKAALKKALNRMYSINSYWLIFFSSSVELSQ